MRDLSVLTREDKEEPALPESDKSEAALLNIYRKFF